MSQAIRIEQGLETMPLERFHFDARQETLVAQASDFGPLREGLWWLGKLYRNTEERGIAIRSQATGVTQRFVLVREEVLDGELLAWHFAPTGKCRVRRVTIFND